MDTHFIGKPQEWDRRRVQPNWSGLAAAEDVVRVLTGQSPRYPVNPEALQAGPETVSGDRR